MIFLRMFTLFSTKITKLIYLPLPTACVIKISLQSTGPSNLNYMIIIQIIQISMKVDSVFSRINDAPSAISWNLHNRDHDIGYHTLSFATYFCQQEYVENDISCYMFTLVLP